MPLSHQDLSFGTLEFKIVRMVAKLGKNADYFYEIYEKKRMFTLTYVNIRRMGSGWSYNGQLYVISLQQLHSAYLKINAVSVNVHVSF